MLRHTHINVLLGAFLWAWLTGTGVSAQPSLHLYEAHIVAEGPDAALKLLFSNIVDEYSTADVAHDNDNGILTVSSSFDLNQEWFASICASAGFRLTALWRDGEEVWKELVEDAPAGMAPIDNGPNNNGLEK
jgi:hypothetical protein